MKFGGIFFFLLALLAVKKKAWDGMNNLIVETNKNVVDSLAVDLNRRDERVISVSISSLWIFVSCLYPLDLILACCMRLRIKPFLAYISFPRGVFFFFFKILPNGPLLFFFPVFFFFSLLQPPLIYDFINLSLPSFLLAWLQFCLFYCFLKEPFLRLTLTVCILWVNFNNFSTYFLLLAVFCS